MGRLFLKSEFLRDTWIKCGFEKEIEKLNQKKLRDEEEDKGGEEGPIDSIHVYIKQKFPEQFLLGRHCSRDFGSYEQGQEGSSP